jgi:formate hydrogenlyase subunit 3/multisubunit Na+/H+ antiporter MnhD subunit
LCYLLGVALLYRHYGTLDFAQLAALAQADPLTWAALALVTAGLLLKTALLPLHFWLPSAHANAPAPVSAVLSALVVKASFYLIARYWLDILSPAVTDLGSMLLGLLGAVAVIWGCVAAFRAHRLKLLVAYSTVAQLGYLFLLFPLAASGTDTHMALEAVVYFIVAHALAKAAMFLAAGNILRACGHDDIARLRGVAGQQPASLFIFAIAGVSLIGLPPSGGFIAKWLLLNTAISSGQWWWAVVVLCGGLLAALYIFKVLNLAFVRVDLPSGQIPQPVSAPTHAGMTLCAFALAIGAVALGFSAEWLVTLLDAGSSVTTFSQGAGT